MSLDEMMALSEKLADFWVDGRSDRVEKTMGTLPDDAHRSFVMGLTLMGLSGKASEEMARSFYDKVITPHMSRVTA